MDKLKKYKPTRFMAADSHYSKDAADHAVCFIEKFCRHTKGTWDGKPFELIDWQEQIIRDIFGILKPNGYRQFNTAYVEIPKKQGKSELAAAVALYLLCADFEPGAEVYGCAADRNQAQIVFDVALQMVKRCPALEKRMNIKASQKEMEYIPTGSKYKALSADVANKHGFNIHGVIFDELHTQPNRKLYDVMTKGSGDARMQPLYFLITTAGNDTNSICYEVHQKAKDIIEGRKIDPSFYPVIYGADERDDWTSPKVWKKANPSLGVTVGIDKVEAACEQAKQNPAEENTFRQLRLNQWVKQSVRWMPMEKWDKCAFAVDEDELEGRVCYGGLDLSSTTDITAFVLVFPPTEDDDRYIVLPYFWIPEETLELRVRRDHVPYDLWQRQGFLQTTEGNVVHYGFIEKFIESLGERFNIREIAFDRWGAVQMVQNLENKLLRIERNLSQSQLAEMLGKGKSTISMWESGAREPDFETLELIADTFNVSMDRLLNGKDSIKGIIPLPKFKKIPLLGTIACGDPILAAENLDGFVNCAEFVAADFALKCKGDSMINARIFDGDIVFIRQQPDVDDGEIAAVLISDEVTLKRVHKYPNKLVLSPCNPMYDDFVYTGEQLNEIQILGKAVAFLSAVR